MLLYLQNIEKKKNILHCQKRWLIVLKRNNFYDKLKAEITKLENKIGNES